MSNSILLTFLHNNEGDLCPFSESQYRIRVLSASYSQKQALVVWLLKEVPKTTNYLFIQAHINVSTFVEFIYNMNVLVNAIMISLTRKLSMPIDRLNDHLNTILLASNQQGIDRILFPSLDISSYANGSKVNEKRELTSNANNSTIAFAVADIMFIDLLASILPSI
ncbi:CLUMA_CG010843, isoform A [Clunio marinus]|uniref:CLUMA_CG010843, isoform A n=1 Tax=Clunio marinus TaxID=568069 RepID=A0A1J1IEM7_9DIPT|nr:CLUMA_CG010843, isoform A [Clunio marinus]